MTGHHWIFCLSHAQLLLSDPPSGIRYLAVQPPSRTPPYVLRPRPFCIFSNNFQPTSSPLQLQHQITRPIPHLEVRSPQFRYLPKRSFKGFNTRAPSARLLYTSLPSLSLDRSILKVLSGYYLLSIAKWLFILVAPPLSDENRRVISVIPACCSIRHDGRQFYMYIPVISNIIRSPLWDLAFLPSFSAFPLLKEPYSLNCVPCDAANPCVWLSAERKGHELSHAA